MFLWVISLESNLSKIYDEMAKGAFDALLLVLFMYSLGFEGKRPDRRGEGCRIKGYLYEFIDILYLLKQN